MYCRPGLHHLLPHAVGTGAIAQKRLRFPGAHRHAHLASDAQNVIGGDLSRNALGIGFEVQHIATPHWLSFIFGPRL